MSRQTVELDLSTGRLHDPVTGHVIGAGYVLRAGRAAYGSLTQALLSLPGTWTAQEAHARLGLSTRQSLSSLASWLCRHNRLLCVRKGQAGRGAIYQTLKR